MGLEGTYFVLEPFVVLVKGACQAALYDLHRKRILPIPAATAYVVEQCRDRSVAVMLEGIELENREMAQEYLRDLKEMGFGREHDSEDLAHFAPFHDAWPDYKMDRLYFLSLDLHLQPGVKDGSVCWEDLLRVARHRYGGRQVTMFVTGEEECRETELSVVETAATLGFHHVEVVFPNAEVGPAWEEAVTRLGVRVAFTLNPDPHLPVVGRLHQKKVHVRFSPFAAPAFITSDSFLCDHESFRRLRNVSVHCNSLHITASGAVFPWVLEKHQLIGYVRDGNSLRQLMQSDSLRRAWSFTKDSVEQCRDCEFRYACPQSPTLRKVPEKLGAPPINCTYDPYRAEWQPQTEPRLFAQAIRSDRLACSTRYFDIYDQEQRPFPSGYGEMLDRVVDAARQQLGLDEPTSRLAYFFYPTQEELAREIRGRCESHVSGITVLGHGDDVEIHSSYPCHVHEVLHALFMPLNHSPAFFVSEACATIFGRCWGTEEDLAMSSLLLAPDMRVLDRHGNEIADLPSFIYDTDGLLLGALRRGDVHDVTRHLVAEQSVDVHLWAWLESQNAAELPGYFYDVGGSFFAWLVEARGKQRFLRFYRSKQSLRHIEGHYGCTVTELQEQWLGFLRTR